MDQFRGRAGFGDTVLVFDIDQRHHATYIFGRIGDVDAVYADWDGAKAEPLSRLTRKCADSLDLPPGSMAPKVEAALRFAENTGRPAVVGSLDEAAGLLSGACGTRFGCGS